ncbi:UDP-Glycosyltransferase/glycogen phosphorylase [Exidia glandulosa HHB12029]|uniref:UDP-Glycosyltransferase/glycogen phosphorylase n=1 Tax=Exidia glandulosa HHB12029 TaxID=1314781 RepID=A0A165GA86_EXIGL|nr:UDP-Glycosyltransferase/glycogen phosphorylase [Exidia glandulosa HHB12029]
MVVVDSLRHMRDMDDMDDDKISPPEYTANDNGSGMLDPPPAFKYSEFKVSGDGLKSAARVERDGRIAVSLKLHKKLPDMPVLNRIISEFGVDEGNWRDCPPLSIVIMIVGSRGDVQPYVALAKRLRRDGHRIRIASHGTFRDFVEGQGLDFFDIGGDPHELMSYMVKNPGLIPGIASLTNGDIKKKRIMMMGCWNSCHSPDQKTGIPFVADAIISNPPAFAHIHCAEALGIPLLMSFTMPWCATGSFPHPLVNISTTNAGERLTNYLSYALADTMTWQGVGDIVNKLRNRTMGLPSLSLRSGPDILDRVKVPWTYCMSPALVPKPADWANHIDVVGFYFLDLATSYTPPRDLAHFLASGPPPVYIGFGSVVVDDPVEMTRVIFEATHAVGVRALVSSGWSNLGDVDVPPHVFLLGNVPHDWLFAEERVSAVVHHGGAGTTAIGLAKGRPTVIVPFFGDQQFWGEMIHKSGAGPKPIPQKNFNVENLTAALTYAISPEAKTAAAGLAQSIVNEDGVEGGVDSFYRHLPLLNMRCDLDPSRVAVWWSTKHCLKLSAFAAQVLLDDQRIKMEHLDLHRPKEYDSRKQYTDPITAGVVSMFWMLVKAPMGVAELFYNPVDGIIHTTTALPNGFMKLVIHFHEGLHNLPTLYGSTVRSHKPIRGVTDGLIEGSKGLALGVYDGITGLVTAPMKGAAEDGVIGGLKGSAKSLFDFAFKPLAGGLGFVSLPLKGAYRQLRLLGSKDADSNRRVVRISQGHEEARQSTFEQRSQVLRRFMAANTKEKLEERRGVLIEAARREIERARASKKSSTRSTSAGEPGPSTSARPLTPPPAWSSSSTDSPEDERFRLDMERALSLSISESTSSSFERSLPATPITYVGDEDDEEELTFQRSMDLAKQASLSEHLSPYASYTNQGSSYSFMQHSDASGEFAPLSRSPGPIAAPSYSPREPDTSRRKAQKRGKQRDA